MRRTTAVLALGGEPVTVVVTVYRVTVRLDPTQAEDFWRSLIQAIQEAFGYKP